MEDVFSCFVLQALLKFNKNPLTNQGKVNKVGQPNGKNLPYPDARCHQKRRNTMPEEETEQVNSELLIALKDEILDVLNQLRQTSAHFQKGIEVTSEKVNTLLAHGESLALRIGSLPGMAQAGEEFLDHVKKIGQAIKDLKDFDALKKENLITGVKF
jgi:hypothetical protein